MRPIQKPAVRSLLTLLFALSACTASCQFNIPGLGSKGKSDAERQTKLLQSNLPLALNANDAYPTVPDEDLLGGPFHGHVLPITLNTLTKPLPPGDYVVPMTFFCSEHSVHRGGLGTAYALGPAEGSASTAISTLLWRGTLTGHKPEELQAVSWAIQGGVPYDKMPANYKKLIDQLIPDLKAQVNGQGWATIQSGMQGTINRGTKKVSDTLSKGLGVITGGKGHVSIQVRVQMDQQFEQLGRLGKMAIDGENISDIVQATYPSDQARSEALFAGQGEQLPAVPAANGPWSVKVPGVAYMRFVVKGGNLQGNNLMQIRILPPSVSQLFFTHGARLVPASYAPGIVLTPTLIQLFSGVADDAAFALCTAGTDGLGALGPCEVLGMTVGGMTAYALGGAGAQAPIMVPAVAMVANGGGDGGPERKEASRENRGNIPKDAQDTKEYIDKNGGNLEAPGRPGYGAEGKGDGSEFKNFEGKLPKLDVEGNKISYREWDVRLKQGNRGTDRVVTGSDGRQWFTSDHYNTFIPMN